jgi:hypothetical protein
VARGRRRRPRADDGEGGTGPGGGGAGLGGWRQGWASDEDNVSGLGARTPERGG